MLICLLKYFMDLYKADTVYSESFVGPISQRDLDLAKFLAKSGT